MEIDYLTCGRCLKEYPLQNITLFIEHKKLDCNDEATSVNLRESQGLQCLSCPKWFMTAVGLLRHAQIIHNLKLFLEKEDYFSDITYNKSHKFSFSNSLKNQSSNKAVQNRQEVKQTNLQYPNQSDKVFHHEEFENQSEKPSYSTSSYVDQSKTPIQDQLEKPLNVTIFDDLNANKSVQDDTSPRIEEIKSEESPTDYESFNIKDPISDISVVNSSAEMINEHLPKFSNITVPKTNDKIYVNRKQIEYFKSHIFKHNKLSEKDRGVGSLSNENICINIEPETSMASLFSSNAGKIRMAPKSISKCTNNKEFSVPQVSGIPRSVGNSLQIGKTNSLTRKGALVLKSGPVFSIPIQYNTQNQIKTKYTQNHQNLDCRSDARTCLPVTESGLYCNQISGNDSSPKCQLPFALSNTNSDGENSLTETEKPLVKMEPITLNEDIHKSFSMDVLAGTGTCGGINDLDNNVNYIRKAYIRENSCHSKGNLLNRRGGVCRKRRYPTTKPFKCEQCDCAFNQRIHLKKHMSKHTGIKPYKCLHCDYSTVERSHLTVHIRTHTGEKPFKCTYCGYATAQKSTLNMHLKRHHIET